MSFNRSVESPIWRVSTCHHHWWLWLWKACLTSNNPRCRGALGASPALCLGPTSSFLYLHFFPKHDLEQMLLDTTALLQGSSRKITAEEGDTELLKLYYKGILICTAKRGQVLSISNFSLIRPTFKHPCWLPSSKAQAKCLVWLWTAL